MRNYNVYLKGMEKSISEKLFFLNEIDISDFNTIIDFGCGKGDILKACYLKEPSGHISLIGVDKDTTMINYAKENVPQAIFINKLPRELLSETTLIIFSSVFHELGDYWKELKNIIKKTGATIIIRDMNFSDEPEPISRSDLAKLIKYSHPKYLSQFVDKYGLKNDRDMYHYLLKYSYIDNWDLELQEDYFSFDWNELLELGTICYRNDYVLDFKQQRVLKDFGITLTKPTHTQLIMRLHK